MRWSVWWDLMFQKLISYDLISVRSHEIIWDFSVRADVPDECLAKYIHNSAAFLKVFRNQTFDILPSVIFRLTNRFRGFIAHPVRVVNGKLGLRGHWIIFDEDICGFLSAPDECLFTLYHRMQNPLLQQQLEDRP